MANNTTRIDYNNLTRGQIIALNIEHPDALHFYPSSYIAIKGDSINYDAYLTQSPYGETIASNEYINIDGVVNTISPTFDNLLDVPNLTDIESVNFEPYYDTASKSQKIRAIIKIRNSSKNSLGVESIDTRIFNPNTAIIKVDTLGSTQSAQFITPTPSEPNVIFKRDGSTISWGWDNSTGLGSYSNVTYEWIISTTNSSNAPALDNGIKTYSSTESYPIGTSSYMKTYKISSRDGDTAATLSARWLRVRAKVVGTDGNTYYSNYSTPI